MNNKVTKLRVANAFRAMKDIGITEDKVKPVLKNLLTLFEKNWILIEAENYRALADAIFESEETEAAEVPEKIDNSEAAGPSNKIVHGEEDEAEETEELERPLKRRHKYQDSNTTRVTRTPLIIPKDEPTELPKSLLLKPSGSRDTVDSTEIGGVKSQATTCQSHGKNKGKQPRSSDCQPNGMIRSRNSQLNSESSLPSHPMTRRAKERRPVSESSSNAICLKEPRVEPGTVSQPKQKTAAWPVLIIPKEEPVTDDMPILEPPIAVIHPDPSNGGDSSSRNGTIEGDYGPEPPILQSTSQLQIADGTISPNEPTNNRMLAIPSGDAPGVEGLCTSSMNQSQSNAEVPLTIASRSHSICEGTDRSRVNEMAAGDEKHEKPQVTPRSLADLVDIAKGQERVVITVVNEVNEEGPPSFHYIPRNAIFQNAYVSFSLARFGDKDSCSTCVGNCLSLDTPCACSYETGGEFAYTIDGLVKEELLKESTSMNRDPKKHCQFFCKECPLEKSKNGETAEPCKGHLVRRFIKECWLKCGCNKMCGNRVVQRGISRNLQVFMTLEGKGWGLRTLEDLPKGAFVCEYVGEVLTNAELFDRVLSSPDGEKHSYPVLLDADWCAEGVLKDEDALCLDATYYGNVARFINHRCCDSNMVEIPVEVETPDHHYYRLAFFTTRKVKAMEELTWDYGIDFDDIDHPVKAFRCQCRSRFCRNTKSSRRSARRS